MIQTRRTETVNVIAFVKGADRYVLLFEDWQWSTALRQLVHWAADPRLSFGWHDAAVVSKRIRQAMKEK